MRKYLLFFILFTLMTLGCIAQLYIEPALGYSHDARNEFNHVNTAIQLAWDKHDKLDFLIRLEKGWVSSYYFQDSSFTLNSAMPLHASAGKRIKPDLWTLAGGLRIKLKDGHSKNLLSVLLYLGVSYQKIKVNYQYVEDNYIILNPDKTRERFGACVSGGLEYMRLFKNGRLFTQAIFTTPPIRKNNQYPSSFGFIIPISLNVGYSIPLSKPNHEKEKS